MKPLQILIAAVLAIALVLCIAPAAWAFCGFYVAKADANLYNQASQVAIARNGNRTVMTMANDFRGNVKDFAVVVPVPVVVKKEQVNVGDRAILERLDAFSAPRLVEYFDPDPCAPAVLYDRFPSSAPMESANRQTRRRDSLGVTVEARFSVGEYDIVVLSAKESGGLETWLRRNGYRIPAGAKPLLQPYIRQKMKFFVAKVNLAKFEQSGYTFLRPLQIAYESPRFMLPIRLGMVNAQTEQDLIVYLLSPKGRVELTNYRTVNIPSNTEIPLFVKPKFSDFYRAMFQTVYNREGKQTAFLEYAWDMGSCDPCSADPLTPTELKKAGVFWLNSDQPNVFVTRLHVRYSRAKFPEDLMFQETSDRQQFQGRYILNHPFTGAMKCPAAKQYQQTLRQRRDREAKNLTQLTGWKLAEIRRQM